MTLQIPLFEHHPSHAAVLTWTAEEVRIADDLRTKGYAVLDFPEPAFAKLADEIIADLQDQLCGPGETDGKSGKSVRVQDHDLPSVRQIAGNAEVQALLSKIYGRQAFPFQTLNFSVGTQQPVHSDDVHFSSYPKGFMCGVWVALEDIHPDAGPLAFYPRSHRLENVDGIGMGEHPLEHPNAQPAEFAGGTQKAVQKLWDTSLKDRDIPLQHFLGKKGQALIWVYNLLHGGALRKDIQRTRWSQVTHYYFEGCDYYTPLLSEYQSGDVHFRDNVIDLKSDALKSAEPHPVLPADFDPERYLELNPDVRGHGASPDHHWMHHGFFEKRRYK